MRDSYGREIDYIRVSVTDRCNLRCRYCMPDDIKMFPREEILTWEEILFVLQAAAQAGIKKIKITGGEPLVRKDCPEFIGKITAIPGIEQVTMTTNGVLLQSFLPELVDGGLSAVNISIDTLDHKKYERITGSDRLPEVLSSLRAALDSPLKVKVNVVLQQNPADLKETFPSGSDSSSLYETNEWEELIALAKDRPVDVRFIEMMPVGSGKRYTGVPNTAVRRWLYKSYPGTQKDTTIHGNGPAVYDRIPGFAGAIGFISAIHGKFCDRCNRIRLTSMGNLKPCLCYADYIPLKPILRDTRLSAMQKEEKIIAAIRDSIRAKPQGHCFGKITEITECHDMNQIGG